MVGTKQHKDGSSTFSFVGGPYNGMKFRSYPPHDPIPFPAGGGHEACVYELHEPIRKNGKWVFAHRKEITT